MRAIRVFGRDTMSMVPPNKTRNDLTVSHICGTRKCCSGAHLLLEPKFVNDSRTHCHFHVHHLLKGGGSRKAVLKRVKLIRGICPHNPRCFSYVGRRLPERRVFLSAEDADAVL